MSDRPRLVLVLIFLALLTLTLSACNRERPVPANATTGTPAARGTVAAPSTGITQVAPSTTTGAQEGAPTPAAPQPQSVVVSPAPAASGSGQTFAYTVVAGDTLLTIATRFGTTPEAIAQLNSLADPNALTLGQKLQIPGAAAAAGAAATSSAGQSSGGTTGGATAGGGATTYTVQSGDTLGVIARRFGTTVAELVRINNLANPDALQVGQKLTVPGSGGAAVSVPTAGQGKSYTVQRGDTLLSIARRFGLTVKQLQAANNISNPDRIYPGQVLTIP